MPENEVCCKGSVLVRSNRTEAATSAGLTGKERRKRLRILITPGLDFELHPIYTYICQFGEHSLGWLTKLTTTHWCLLGLQVKKTSRYFPFNPEIRAYTLRTEIKSKSSNASSIEHFVQHVRCVGFV